MRGPCNDSGRRASAWALTMLFFVTCCLTIDSTAQGATVRDEFNAISYSGNNGTADWTGDWIEVGESNGPSSGFLRVVSTPFCTVGNCMRLGINGDNDNKYLVREADLAGATFATFTYNFETRQADRGFVHVEVSGNGGGSWTTLATYDLDGGDVSGSESFDISAYIAADTQVRFRGTNRDDNPSSMEQFRGFIHFDDIEISSDAPAVSLNIVKRAFWPNGTPGPTGAAIPSGVEFKFLLYVNNTSSAVTDVSVRDVLDTAFQYQTETIQVDNSVVECAVAVCTAGEELTIFTAVDGTAILTDAVDGDVGSYTGTSLSVDTGDGAEANGQLNINADAVWAVLFSVKMP